MRRCSIAGCLAPRHARTYCNTHYQRWRKYGDARADDPTTTTSCARCGERIRRSLAPTRCARCVRELTALLDVYARAAVLFVLADMARDATAEGSG